MRTTMLPDPNTANLDVPCDAGYWPSFISHARSGPVYFREHWGPLSIKCTVAGTERYQTQGERYTVRPDNYLILNTGQLYSCEIPVEQMEDETEAFTVFFRPQLAEEVLSAIVNPDDTLLDEPHRINAYPVTFFEGPHHHDTVVSPLVRQLRAAGESGVATPGWYEEQFNLLLAAMLCQHRGVVSKVESLPFKRRPTRIEIYRRLLLARDYIDGNYGQELRLGDIAGTACMALHHFLRMFHAAFHVTPHQYLTEKRLCAARRLLATTDMPVTDICIEVGFVSLGSFSTLFSRTAGMSPVAYRKAFRRSP